MKAFYPFYLIIFFFLFSNKITAQERPLAFTLVRGSNEVSLGKITGITQDILGYMWFVDQGNSQLVRYDGYRMKVFKCNPADSNSINLGGFECVAADSSGNVWLPVGTGIDRINSVTGTVTHYKLKVAMGEAIIVDHLGMIWVGGNSGGLCQLDPKTGKAIYYSHNDNDPTTLSTNAVRVLYEDKAGTIWAGCGYPFGPGNDGGLNRLNRATGKFTRYMNNPADPTSIINNRVRSIFEDSRGTFWIGTQGDGLQILDRTTGKFDRQTYDASRPDKLSRPPVKKGDIADHITFIKEDISGNIWIGTYKEGIERYNPFTKKITHFYNDSLRINGFADSTTWTAFASRDGTLWIATEYSFLLYRVDAFSKVLMHISTGSIANSFVEDKNGYLWVGTEGNGIFKFDRDYKMLAHFIHNPSDSLSLPANNSMISVAMNDKIWAHTYRGIRVIDGQSNKFNKVNTSDHLFRDAPDHGFVDGLEDKNGIQWFACWGQGLLRYDPKNGSAKQYLPNLKDSSSINSVYFNHLIEDRQGGALWISGGDGISRMDLKTEKVKSYLYGTFTPGVYRNSNNDIWAGTAKGLFKYDVKLDSFTSFFNPLEDISTWPVGGITEDNNHLLWLISNSSMIKLNPLTKEFFIYGDKYGIARQSMVPWTKSFKNQKGQVFFGTDDGFSVLDPQELDIRNDFKIHITDLFINTISVLPGKQSAIKNPVGDLDELNLKYNQNNIVLNFSAMDYRDPESISYFTMLEGYENTWKKVMNEKSSNYFNLHRGKYIYHIKAINKDGQHTEKIITILINPPWWQTWWAYTIYIVLLILAIWGYAKWRTKTLETEKIILERKVGERTQELKKEKEIVESTLAELKSTQAQLIQSEKMASLGELTAGIAHEIQNPLNFVNNFSELNGEMIDEVSQEIENGNFVDVKGLLNDIKRNEQKINFHGKRADAIVKGMLQHSNPSSGKKESIDLNAFCDEYFRLSYLGFRAKDKNFNAELKTEFDEGIRKINIIPHEIARVLLNLFNNAFYAVNEKQKTESTTQNVSYSPSVKIQTKGISSQPGDQGVEIVISDNGIGIPSTIIDKIFQPFFTNKPTGQGTGLGLSLAYDIITKAHNGTIKVVSKEGEGSVFKIFLPYF
jgi:signal transduction histidine kinase/ligand-binding sensor domain-containing protein